MVLSKLIAVAAFASCLDYVSGTAVVSQIESSVMSSLKLLSKDEIMASMTTEKAMNLVTHSKRLQQRPDLLAMIRSEVTKSNTTVSAHGARGHQAPTGYASVVKAKDMLNEMMNSATAKLENEGWRCRTYNTETLGLLENLRGSVSSFNAKAAEERGKVLKAQQTIAFTEEELEKVQDRLDQHNKDCAHDISALKLQIEVVLADLDVMAVIMDIIGDCGVGVTTNLLQCRHCRNIGEGAFMLQDMRLQRMLKKLKTTAAKAYVREGLRDMYDEATEDQEPEMLTQEEVRRQRAGLQSGLRLRRQDPADQQEAQDSSDGNGTNVSEVPDVVQPVDCIPTAKCTLGKGSCPKIRDRFLNVQAGIQDLSNKLQEELAQKVKTCEEERKEMKSQIGNLNDDLSEAQTDLAEATKGQVEAELSSHLTADQHTKKKDEYGTTMKDCCQEQNDLKSEICALEKIRGEMLKMKGVKVFISDCEVSDWTEEACSVSCGGGTMRKTRSIMVHPNGGAACPPLEMQETCNAEPCPIDCKVSDWEEWSACTAECGGGVKERVRNVVQQASHGGVACGETEESQVCNAEACDSDCILGEWSQWGACTQACWGGTQRRNRDVAVPARGTGTCADAADPSRLNFRSCNQQPCKDFYYDSSDGDYLKCGSKLDVIILMDGSGSLGAFGWKKSKVFVEHLLRSMPGGDGNVIVALQVFSGPTTWPAYKSCTGEGAAPDMEKDCRITWISHFTNNTKDLAKKVRKLEFPDATTMTSMALAEAENELLNGREDANSLVIVLTDGKPMSPERTEAAAHQLMQKARVLWVPAGEDAPLDLVQKLASLPKNENVVHISSLNALSSTFFTNKVIAQSCPTLVNPIQNSTRP